MIDNIEKVLQFHKASGMPTLIKPGFLDNKRIDLRVSLLREEVKELEDAAYTADLVEVLDALCDIQYILHGAVLDYGVQEFFKEACDEVHRSNMSKFCTTTADARESVNRYFDKGEDTHYKKVGDVFVIYRDSDNKILKGMHFYPPNLKKIIDKYKRKEVANA